MNGWRDYFGSDEDITRQKRIKQKIPWIRQTPGVCNGARLLNFDDPQRVGWNQIRQAAHELSLVGFPGAEEAIYADIASHLGEVWQTSTWLTLLPAHRKM
jgi:hypothetical protein